MITFNDDIVMPVISFSLSSVSAPTSFSFKFNYIVRLWGDLGRACASCVVRFRGYFRCAGVVVRQGDYCGAGVILFLTKGF